MTIVAVTEEEFAIALDTAVEFYDSDIHAEGEVSATIGLQRLREEIARLRKIAVTEYHFATEAYRKLREVVPDYPASDDHPLCELADFMGLHLASCFDGYDFKTVRYYDAQVKRAEAAEVRVARLEAALRKVEELASLVVHPENEPRNVCRFCGRPFLPNHYVDCPVTVVREALLCP